MKRSIAFALVAALALAPAACGGNQPADSGAPAAPAEGTAGTGAPAVGAPAAETPVAGAPGAGEAAADSPANGATPAAPAPGATGEAGGTPLPTGPTSTPDPTVVALIEGFKPPAKGADDALITIYEFSDFLCPYCRQFADETYRQVDEAYVKTGRAKLIFWHFPLKSHGWPAVVSAEASLCAGDQGQFWRMHDTLFADWEALTDLPPDDEEKAKTAMIGFGEKISQLVDLDLDAYGACITSSKYRPVLSVLARQALDDLQINATPSFLIQAGDHFELVAGFLPFEAMQKVLDREISRAQGTPIPTDTPTVVATGTTTP